MTVFHNAATGRPKTDPCANKRPIHDGLLLALGDQDLCDQIGIVVSALEADFGQRLLGKRLQPLLGRGIGKLRGQALKAVTGTGCHWLGRKAADLVVNQPRTGASSDQGYYHKQSYQRFIHKG